MATKKLATATPKHWLSIAAFCMHVLEDRDGVLSGIRFLDQVTLAVPADRDPEERVHVSLLAFIVFKSDNWGGGDHVLRLMLRTPTGKKLLIREFPMKLESHVTGFSQRVKVDLKIKTPGLYKMDVILDGKRYTSMPLWVVFEETNDRDRTKTGSNPVGR